MAPKIYDSTDHNGIPVKPWKAIEVDGPRIPALESIIYHMGGIKPSVERKMGERGVEYNVSFMADNYTGQKIGNVLRQNGYANDTYSFSTNYGWKSESPEDVLDRLNINCD